MEAQGTVKYAQKAKISNLVSFCSIELEKNPFSNKSVTLISQISFCRDFSHLCLEPPIKKFGFEIECLVLSSSTNVIGG